jgi:hypothetical protein
VLFGSRSVTVKFAYTTFIKHCIPAQAGILFPSVVRRERKNHVQYRTVLRIGYFYNDARV